MNKCIFLGRLTADPELKRTQSDMAVCNFTLAVDRKFKKDGQPSADFLNMVAYNKPAENIAKYCAKGSMLAVVARVQIRSWDDTEGKKHYATEFIVDEFDFAGSSKSSGGNNSKATSSDEEEFAL